MADKWAGARRRAERAQRGEVSLFDAWRNNAGPEDAPTSIEAAVATVPRKRESRSVHRAEVLDALQWARENGLTDDELAQELPHRHPGGTSKRRGDLVKAGLVVDSGRRRKTRFGSDAICWVAAEFAP